MKKASGSQIVKVQPQDVASRLQPGVTYKKRRVH